MRKVNIGKEYRHFKGGVYRVYTVSSPVDLEHYAYGRFSCLEAEHTESREKFDVICVNRIDKTVYYHDKSIDEGELVIYSKDNTKFWARPEPMFLSKVDKKKHPQATQEYRLEEI